jgi:predicted flavoprotein YhiN
MFSYRHSKLGIEVLTGQSVQSLFKKEQYGKIETQNENYLVEKLILATTEATPKYGK